MSEKFQSVITISEPGEQKKPKKNTAKINKKKKGRKNYDFC